MGARLCRALAWARGQAGAFATAVLVSLGAGGVQAEGQVAPAVGAAAFAAAQATVEIPGARGRLALTDRLRVLQDREGHLQAADLLTDAGLAGFKPLPDGPAAANFGRTGSVMWFTATLRRASGAPHDWLLEVGYPSMDRVDVWWRGPDGRVVHQVSGDLVPMALRPVHHRSLVFPVTLPAEGEVRVLLRLQSTGTVSALTTLWQPAALARHDQRAYAALGLYFGLLGALLLYNLLLYVSLRETAYLVYVGFVASMALAQLAISGFGAQFLWPGWPVWAHLSMNLGFGLAGLLAAQFARSFLDTRRVMPRADRVLRVMILMFVVALVATPFYTREAGILVNAGGAAGALLALVVSARALMGGDRRARFFLLAWSMLMIAVGIGVMHSAGWLPSNTITIHALLIGSAMEMLLLSFALADRIQTDRRARESAQAEAMAAGEAMLHSLRESERLLDARVQQRTHELARANEQLVRNERELQRLAHHDPLTGLPNRKLFHDRLSHAIDRARRQETAFALLTLDLDGFKTVNDSHGHGAGDELLVALSQRVTESLRASDTVARWGGDEFVLLLEDISDPFTAQPPVAKLAALIEEPLRLRNGALVQVGASIGVACFPTDGDTPEALLEHADRAMYVAKDVSRRRRAA